jgi:hypothetical protein
MLFNWSDIIEFGVICIAVAIGTWIILSVLVSAVERGEKRRLPP